MESGHSSSSRGALLGALLLAVVLCVGLLILRGGAQARKGLLEWNAASGSLLSSSSSSSILTSSAAILTESGLAPLMSTASGAFPNAATGGILINYSFETSSSSSSQVAEPGSLRIPIFMYHYLEVVRNPKDTLRVRLAVTPTIFEEQLATLQKNGFHTLFVRDVPAILSGSLQVSRPVVLTFDDGYEDFYTEAFPLLKKYQAHATLFLINDFIGKGDYLTEAQIREIVASGLVEIGAHTLDHLDLRTLSINGQTRQILGSKDDLESRFGVAVTSFAYPSGRYTADTLSIVRKSGFTAAVSTNPGSLQAPSLIFTLRRLREMDIIGKKTLQAFLGK